jgi:hypothetical protein
MAIKISDEILKKLRDKHQVTAREVDECFLNMTGNPLKDDRDKHKTNPPTMWFIAETNKKRLLKICYIIIDGNVHIKSAFEPNEHELRIYRKYS